MMHHVVLPFALSKNVKTKAVSEQTFTIQSPRAQYRAVTFAELRFMTVYEQERYNMKQWAFTETYEAYKAEYDAIREATADGTIGTTPFKPLRNDVIAGNVRSNQLKALDELPQWIELEVVNAAAPEDRYKVRKTTQMEHVSTAFSFGGITPLVENNRTIQRMLIYDTNLSEHLYGGWVGSLKCDMRNLGSVRLDRGIGNTITIRASMYDYSYRPLGEFPSIQLGLVFQ